MNILDMFLRASPLVKINIFILICFSIVSWSIIFHKVRVLNTAIREISVFEDKFWSGIELPHLYQESTMNYNNLFGIEKIFFNGFKEFTRISQTNDITPKSILGEAYRAMYISMNRELEALETHIPFLGTIGSIGPYIGLFGTVCGVIHAFITIGIVKQATLQMVAPNIGEALITTAIGLLVAIPAVVAYNCFNQYINKIELNYNNFMKEFTITLHHYILTSNKSNKKQYVQKPQTRTSRS